MTSFTSFTERADMIARLGAAYALMAMLFIFNIIAIPVPLIGSLKAPLLLMGIYYWSIYRPTLIPVWAVFIAGCLMDLLSGLPLGMNALVFVAAQWLVSGQRRFLTGQPFIMVWIGFGLVCFSAVFVQWAIFGLISLRWLSVDMFFASALFGVALFPVICIILHLTHKILPMPRSVMRAHRS